MIAKDTNSETRFRVLCSLDLASVIYSIRLVRLVPDIVVVHTRRVYVERGETPRLENAMQRREYFSMSSLIGHHMSIGIKPVIINAEPNCVLETYKPK